MLTYSMKTKYFVVLISLVLAVGFSGCSENEYDPDDYVTSVLSGEYSEDGMWKLSVSVNGEPLSDFGYVRFDSKYLKEGDFQFVKVIPNVASKEYGNVPLSITEHGCEFTIMDSKDEKPLRISGVIVLGKMTVDIVL